MVPPHFISKNKYGIYCVPKSSKHRQCSACILKGEIYEPVTLKFMMKRCGNGDIVHAGTYFGDFIPVLSKSISDNAKIWSFEPNVENYQCTLHTIALNSITNVELMNKALGKRISKTNILVKDSLGKSLGGCSKCVEERSDRSLPVELTSIDDVIPDTRHVSIIQLDVEGHEEKVLMGATKTIQRCKPFLVLEDRTNIMHKSEWFSHNILSKYSVIKRFHGNNGLRHK